MVGSGVFDPILGTLRGGGGQACAKADVAARRSIAPRTDRNTTTVAPRVRLCASMANSSPDAAASSRTSGSPSWRRLAVLPEVSRNPAHVCHVAPGGLMLRGIVQHVDDRRVPKLTLHPPASPSRPLGPSTASPPTSLMRRTSFRSSSSALPNFKPMNSERRCVNRSERAPPLSALPGKESTKSSAGHGVLRCTCPPLS